MIDKKVFYNLKCDCCGQLIDETYWDEEEGATAFIDECGWKATEDGKHYCMDCYHIDDEGETEQTNTQTGGNGGGTQGGELEG